MKRPPAHALAADADQLAGALQHFLSGLAREREEQNIGRVDAGIDQIGYAVDQRASLAAPGPGDDQGRSVAGCDGR